MRRSRRCGPDQGEGDCEDRADETLDALEPRATKLRETPRPHYPRVGIDLSRTWRSCLCRAVVAIRRWPMRRHSIDAQQSGRPPLEEAGQAERQLLVERDHRDQARSLRAASERAAMDHASSSLRSRYSADRQAHPKPDDAAVPHQGSRVPELQPDQVGCYFPPEKLAEGVRAVLPVSEAESTSKSPPQTFHPSAPAD